MDSTMIQAVVFACFGLTAMGVYSKVTLLNLLTIPFLVALAIEYGGANYMAGLGFVIWIVFNAYYTFFGGD